MNKNNFTRKTIKISNNDIYINLFLFKSFEINDYVNIKKDESTYEIERQLINPFFIELDFFNDIKRIKINKNTDLTENMKSILLSSYTETINNSIYNGNVENWFSDIGYNILINETTSKIDPVTGKKTTENGIDKLEKSELHVDSITSKAYFFPISINK